MEPLQSDFRYFSNFKSLHLNLGFIFLNLLFFTSVRTSWISKISTLSTQFGMIVFADDQSYLFFILVSEILPLLTLSFQFFYLLCYVEILGVLGVQSTRSINFLRHHFYLSISSTYFPVGYSNFKIPRTQPVTPVFGVSFSFGLFLRV